MPAWTGQSDWLSLALAWRFPARAYAPTKPRKSLPACHGVAFHARGGVNGIPNGDAGKKKYNNETTTRATRSQFVYFDVGCKGHTRVMNLPWRELWRSKQARRVPETKLKLSAGCRPPPPSRAHPRHPAGGPPLRSRPTRSSANFAPIGCEINQCPSWKVVSCPYLGLYLVSRAGTACRANTGHRARRTFLYRLEFSCSSPSSSWQRPCSVLAVSWQCRGCMAVCRPVSKAEAVVVKMKVG